MCSPKWDLYSTPYRAYETSGERVERMESWRKTASAVQC